MSIWPFLWARWYQIFGAIPIRLVLQIVDTSDKCSSFLGVASYLQMSKTWHVLLTMWGPVRSSLSTFIYHNSWSLVDPEGTTHGHLSPLDTTGHLEHSLPCRTCRLLGMEKLENRIFFTTQELGCYQEKIVMQPCENLELHRFTPSQKKGIRLDLTRTREITPES